MYGRMEMKKISQSIFLGVVTTLFPLGYALAQWRGRGYDWGHGPGMMGGEFGGGLLGAIIMVAFWIAVIVGIVFLIRWLALSTKGGTEESALEILKKRYARGEIDKKEFDQKKKDLI
jgi:putative membrane protein